MDGFSFGLLLFTGIYVHANLCNFFRKRLFNMINDVPTIFEVVTGMAKAKEILNYTDEKNYRYTQNQSNQSSVFGEALSLCFIHPTKKLQ